MSEVVPLNGHIKIKVFEKQSDGSEKQTDEKLIKNLIVDVGKDTLLKYIGNVTGGSYAEYIGVGDSTTSASAGQTDLQAPTNYLWKQITSAGRVYVRPTVYVSVDFGYTEANFTWNEIGLRDTNNVLIARQIDGTPLTKTSSKRAIVEWQLSL